MNLLSLFKKILLMLFVDWNINEINVSTSSSDHSNDKLISCVECVLMLWNAKNQNYKNKVERQTAWKHMSELDFESKFTDDELLVKWTHIRIQYRSYFAKFRKTKSGQGVETEIKWKFYRAMSFLGKAEEEQTPNTVSNMVFLFFVFIFIFCFSSQ